MTFGLRALQAISRTTDSIDAGIEVTGNRRPRHHAKGNADKKRVAKSYQAKPDGSDIFSGDQRVKRFAGAHLPHAGAGDHHLGRTRPRVVIR